MKKQLLFTLVVSCISFVGAQSFGESVGSGKEAASTVSKKQSSKKKEKVAMCSECGKPESECTCDHGKKDQKDHQHSEGTEKKESSEHGHSH